MENKQVKFFQIQNDRKLYYTKSEVIAVDKINRKCYLVDAA